MNETIPEGLYNALNSARAYKFRAEEAEKQVEYLKSFIVNNPRVLKEFTNFVLGAPSTLLEDSKDE